MKIKQKKELSKVIAKLASRKDSDALTVKDFKNYVKAQKQTADEQSAEMQELAELSEKAAQEAYESTQGPEYKKNLKAMQAKAKVQEEYRVIKRGYRSRVEDIFGALGVDKKEAKFFGQIFGKKLSKEEKEAGEKKFKIGEKSATQKLEEKRQKVTSDQLKKIFENTKKTLDVLSSLRLTIEGVANKLRASPAAETAPTGRAMRKLEKQSGLKYSKETNRYKDVKTGKFVGMETARQRMNLSTSALKIPGGLGKLIGGAKPAVAGAALASGTGLASKVLEDKPFVRSSSGDTKLAVDTNKNTKEILKPIKKLDPIADTVEDIFGLFSGDTLIKWFGGAIGAAVPFLVDGMQWLWKNIISPGIDFGMNIAKTIGNWLAEVTIPEMDLYVTKIPSFKPFSFLKSEKPVDTPAPPGAKPEQAKPLDASPAPAPAGGGGTFAGGGATGKTPEAAPVMTQGAGGPKGRGGPRKPQSSSGSTSESLGSNMPAAAPPPKTSGKSPAAAGGDYLAMAADFISKEEGLPKGGKAYYDPPNQNNLVSVGYGHQIKEDEYKQGFIDAGGQQIPLAGSRGIDTVMTTDQAKALLAIDLQKYQQRAAAPFKDQWDTLAAAQKAALISYAYNTGSTRSLAKQGLGDAIASNDAKAGGDIISEKGIQTAGGKPHPGLKERRKKEGQLFASASSPGSGISAASGGVAIGPTSGYGATLHGREAIIPLDGQSHQSRQALSAVGQAVSGDQIGKDSTEVQAGKEGAGASGPVIVAGGGGKQQPQMPPQKPNNSMKASVRNDESSFGRALARDFAHPSAFTTVSMT